MTDKNDILVERFLKENRQEIPDDGFSRKVMQHLPVETPLELSRRWTVLCWSVCLLVLLVLFLTGNLHFDIRQPAVLTDLIKDFQSPDFISQFIVANFKKALLLWGILLAGALHFAYKQYKAA